MLHFCLNQEYYEEGINAGSDEGDTTSDINVVSLKMCPIQT